MTQFACTREGAEALVRLANQLQLSLSKLRAASELLSERINLLLSEGRLPREYADACTTVAIQCAREMMLASDPAGILSEELLKLSDSIMQVIADWETTDGQKIIGGVSKGSIDKSSPVDGVEMGDASLVYIDMLGSKFKQMNSDIKQVFAARGWKCRIVDANVQGGAYYNPFEDSVYLNQTDDMSCPLGAGNRFFHEIAHQMDYQSAKEASIHPPLSYSLGMATAVKEDFERSIQCIRDSFGCTISEAEEIMRDRLYAAGNLANCVSDVFGGVTENRVTGFWGHSTSYWSGSQSDYRIASEAFAEMFADKACGNEESISFTKTYMPKAYSVFEQIIKELVDG